MARLAKAAASKPAKSPRAGREAEVSLSKSELIAVRELLDSVMTLASHGILFRVGNILADSIVGEARAKGGPLAEAAGTVLVARHFAEAVRFFPHKIQVSGSIEAKTGEEPTCHVLRGIFQKVVSADGGVFMVREESCASQGGAECVFTVERGGRMPWCSVKANTSRPSGPVGVALQRPYTPSASAMSRMASTPAASNCGALAIR